MLRALTLWQPMAWAISDFTKRIENRPWRTIEPPGEIAIHAGKRYHLEHAEQIAEKFGIDVPPRGAVPQGAVVAVVRVVGLVSADDVPAPTDPWFSGPFGWVLEDVRRLPEPVPCAGALGLWRLPPDVQAAVRRQLA